jgi:hypothetical protein
MIGLSALKVGGGRGYCETLTIVVGSLKVRR